MQPQQTPNDPNDPNAVRRGVLNRMQNGGIAGAGMNANALPDATTAQGSSPGVDGNPPAPGAPDAPAPQMWNSPADEAASHPAAPATTPYDHSTFRDAWLGTGRDVGAQDNILKQYGIGAPSANGTVTLPDGSIMDLRRGAKAGDNTAQWMGVGETHNGQTTMYGQNPGVAGPGASANGSASSGFMDNIRAELLKRMQSASSPVDENATEIAQPFGAAKLEASRGLDEERKAMAERAYAQGGGNVDQGALSQGIQQSMERNAVGLGGIKAQLIGKVYDAKMNDARQALQLAVQSGDAEAARQAQMQIAQLDAAIRRQGLDQSQSQWNDRYGLDKNDAQYQRDRDAARAKAGLNF